MINVATIMTQVKDWLESSPDLKSVVIEKSEFVNEDAGRAVNGWIGIYRKGVAYDPRNLGVAPNNYEAALDFIVIVQRSSIKSGADAENSLEKTIKAVLDRVVQIPRSHIDHFSNLVIDYTYLETDRKTMYFQGALITFTAQVSSEIN